MLSLLQLGLSEYAEKKHVLGSLNLKNLEKHRLSFEDIFFENTRHIYEKKPTLDSCWGGGGAW